MRKCVLDISGKRVGFAVSDDECKFIIKSGCINYNSFTQLRREISELYTKYKIDKTLIGLPFSPNKDKQILLIKESSHNLRDIIKSYEFINENFSTLEAISDREHYKDLTIDEIVCRKLFEKYKDA